MRKERVTITREKLDALMEVAAELRAHIEGASKDLGGCHEALGKLYRAGVKPEDLDMVLE